MWRLLEDIILEPAIVKVLSVLYEGPSDPKPKGPHPAQQSSDFFPPSAAKYQLQATSDVKPVIFGPLPRRFPLNGFS